MWLTADTYRLIKYSSESKSSTQRQKKWVIDKKNHEKDNYPNDICEQPLLKLPITIINTCSLVVVVNCSVTVPVHIGLFLFMFFRRVSAVAVYRPSTSPFVFFVRRLLLIVQSATIFHFLLKKVLETYNFITQSYLSLFEFIFILIQIFCLPKMPQLLFYQKVYLQVSS